MESVDKKPVCLNYEFPCRDCVQPIQFKDVWESYTIGEKITLEYSTLKSYSPKSEDWIGLFKCNPEAENVFEYVTFEWAQKRPSFKSKPLERCVTFNLDDVDLTDDMYIFLYMTLQERIIGQSPRFKFKFYVKKRHSFATIPVKSPTGNEGIEVAEQVAEAEMSVIKKEIEKQKQEESQDNSEKNNNLSEIVPHVEDLVIKKEANQDDKANEIKNLLDKKFNDLEMKNSFLKMRVNRIEDLAGNILTLQKSLQDQMLQCMMVVEANWNLRGNIIKELTKNEANIHNQKKHEPKLHKEFNCFSPDFDAASIFSGSSQTLRQFFADYNEDLKKLKLDKPNNIIVKKAVTDVEAFTDNKSKEDEDNANDVASDTKKSKSLQHNREKTDMLKLVNADTLEKEGKSKTPNSCRQSEKQEMKTGKNYTLDKQIITGNKFSDKATQTPSLVDLHTSTDKNGFSIKIVLNEGNILPCIVVSESERAEALVVDVTQNKSVIIQPVPLHASEDKAKLVIKKNVSTMTTEVEDIAALDGNEKLLASTNHPNSVEGWRKDFEGMEISFENIPPSTDTSMAVQVGSMELVNPLLESSPAATRLALLDSYEMLTAPQKNFAKNITAKRCTAAKITLMRAILESNLTDEEKVSSIGLIYLNNKNGDRPFRKQFPAQSAQTKLPDKTTSTEYETSDVGEIAPEIDDNNVKFDFQKKNRRSRKLKRNRFGRNKFTQTEPEKSVHPLTGAYPVIDESSKFPKLVKRPLPTSIIPVLSDSKNSFVASSEDDVKAKPILKKSSPVTSRSKDGSQSPKKASVTFLLDATTQCDLDTLEKLNNLDCVADSSAQIGTEVKPQEHECLEMQEYKRERKVSFNTIILTSLFDNEEADKDNDSIKYIDEKPEALTKIDGPYKKQNIPPIHQFLDLIEMEAKLMSQNMLKIQNTISNAVRVFKTEAITLKDISAEVFNKAIKSLTSLKFGNLENHDGTNTTTQDEKIPLIRINIEKDSKRIDSKVQYSEQQTVTTDTKEIDGKDADTIEETPYDGKNISPFKNKDSMFYKNILKEINAEILEKVRLNEIVRIQVSDSDIDQSNDPKTSNQSDGSKETDSSTVCHPNQPESLLSGPADLRDFWDFNFGAHRGKRTYSTVPQTSTISPLASLSAPSDDYQSHNSMDAQSLITSCLSGNQNQMRFPGLMLVRSFDSTISNIVNLYNTFTSYAYSSLSSQTERFNVSSPITNDDMDMIRQTYGTTDGNQSEHFTSFVEDGIDSDQRRHIDPNLISEKDDDIIKTLKTIRMMEIERKNSQLYGNEPLDLSRKTSHSLKHQDEVTPSREDEANTTQQEVKDEQLCLTCSDEFPKLPTTTITNSTILEKTTSVPSKKKNHSRRKKRKED